MHADLQDGPAGRGDHDVSHATARLPCTQDGRSGSRLYYPLSMEQGSTRVACGQKHRAGCGRGTLIELRRRFEQNLGWVVLVLDLGYPRLAQAPACFAYPLIGSIAWPPPRVNRFHASRYPM